MAGITYTGILLEWGKATVNNRIYSRAICRRIVEEFAAHGKPFFGVMRRPQDLHEPFALKDASHGIKALKLVDHGDGKTGHIEATIEVLDTPNGKLLAQLITRPDAESFFYLTPLGDGVLQKQKDGTFLIEDSYQLRAVCVALKPETKT